MLSIVKKMLPTHQNCLLSLRQVLNKGPVACLLPPFWHLSAPHQKNSSASGFLSVPVRHWHSSFLQEGICQYHGTLQSMRSDETISAQSKQKCSYAIVCCTLDIRYLVRSARPMDDKTRQDNWNTKGLACCNPSVLFAVCVSTSPVILPWSSCTT